MREHQFPKFFNFKVGNKELWVHPNGTKHIFEFVTRDAQHIGTFTTSISSQSMLLEFGSALNDTLIKNGIIYDKRFLVEDGNLSYQLQEKQGKI